MVMYSPVLIYVAPWRLFSVVIHTSLLLIAFGAEALERIALRLGVQRLKACVRDTCTEKELLWLYKIRIRRRII